MAYQHEITLTAQTPGGPVQKANSYSGLQHAGYSGPITQGTATVIPNVSIDVSAMVSLVIQCDRDIVLTFNDDGTPDATVTLLANKPLIWTDDGYFANPLGNVDITSFKATLASGEDATLLVDAAYD